MDRHAIACLAAQEAFWNTLARLYPGATTGDVDPFRVAIFQAAAQGAAASWVENNAPDPDCPHCSGIDEQVIGGPNPFCMTCGRDLSEAVPHG